VARIVARAQSDCCGTGLNWAHQCNGNQTEQTRKDGGKDVIELQPHDIPPAK
jgi:hypothetical protein